MKRLLMLVLLIGLLAAPRAIGQTNEFISDFNTKIYINKDGTINVIEKISYYFPFQSTRHGIYREIPLIKTNQDGKRFILKASDVRVTGLNDDPLPYDDQSSTSKIYLKIGDPEKYVSGLQIYVISYKISGAISYFKDFDELYWNVTGNDWKVPIQSTQLYIFPPESMQNTQMWCYTGFIGESSNNCMINKDQQAYHVLGSKVLNPGEGMTISIQFPKNQVNVLEPKPDKSWLIQMLISSMLVLLWFILYVLLPLIALLSNIKISKKMPGEKRIVAAWFSPPKTEEGRELTAAEVGVLFDKNPQVRDITAQIIQIAQKGFIKIRQIEGGFLKKEDFEIIKQKEWKDSPDLLPYEQNLLDDLLDKKDKVTISKIASSGNFGKTILSSYKRISSQLVKDKFFKQNVQKQRAIWTFLILMSIFSMNVLGLIASIIGLKAIKKTQKGAEAIAYALSLKNFLVSQTDEINFQSKNQMFFEKLLPYAMVFGVEKIWIDRFKDIALTKPDWADINDLSTFSYGSFISNMSHRTATSFISNTRSSSGFSSGGFGGGSSGGGGGGGGGGSW